MGLTIMIDTFEILKGYSEDSDGRTCMDSDIENFTVCPISVYLNVESGDPIKLCDFDSNIVDKKIHYFRSVDKESVLYYERYGNFQPYSVYFVSRITNDKSDDVKNIYIFDIISTDMKFGMFSKRCEKCLGINGIIRYSGIFKYIRISYRYYMMDIDFKPFRVVVIKNNLVDIDTSVNDGKLTNHQMDPNFLFTDEKYECFTSVTFYGLSLPNVFNEICIHENMKFSNYSNYITSRTLRDSQFVSICFY
ncbi:hypothetical protein RF11_05929 [Thelohanellus kitauei]|uniref:Uncharacterized protein n=1 Tax=Thelohanellus kitauei TaxID=669202 RepID=A0A0C2N6W2_THEKT|nr:hypothetical protein RF11_05929 [Thelohanellus kitauei]